MRGLAIVVLLLSVGACGESRAARAEREKAERTAAAQDTVRMAQAAYDPAFFDTIVWSRPVLALQRGEVVWQVSCMKCHGKGGKGDAGLVLHGDTLRPPSFLAPDWRFATDLEGLRKYIYVGNDKGMPHWGLTALQLHDIDAVARYIQQTLREHVVSAKGAAAK